MWVEAHGHQYGDPMLGRVIRAVMIATTIGLASVACAEGVTLPADADAEIRLGHEIYGARCARCHGAAGGGGIGPTLENIQDRLDDAGQLDVVVNGRNSMPRFDSTLSSEEIAAVVRYTREIL